jgi:hypothetical protein
VAALTTIWFGCANACRRAARFGVSPTTEHVPLDCAAVTRVDIPEIEAAATLEKSSRMWPVLCSAGVG